MSFRKMFGSIHLLAIFTAFFCSLVAVAVIAFVVVIVVFVGERSALIASLKQVANCCQKLAY